MKKISNWSARSFMTVILLIGGALLASVFVAKSFQSEPVIAEEVDLVKDIEPVHKWSDDQYAFFEALKKATPAEQAELIETHWPNLKNDIIMYARPYLPKDYHIYMLEFYFGSGKNQRANDKYGKIFQGKFEDRLLALIHLRGEETPRYFLVECMNGMVTPIGLEIEPVDTVLPDIDFTVLPGQGLCPSISINQALALGEKFNRPLYKDRIDPKNRISYRWAWANKNYEHIIVHMNIGDRYSVYAGDYQYWPVAN